MKIVILSANDTAAFYEPGDLEDGFDGHSYRDTLPAPLLAELDAAEVVLASFGPFGYGVMKARIAPFGEGIETKNVTAVEFSWSARAWRRREWTTFPEAP